MRICILVDSNWTVKLTNFGTEQIISEKMYHNELRLIVSSEGGDPDQEDIDTNVINRSMRHLIII